MVSKFCASYTIFLDSGCLSQLFTEVTTGDGVDKTKIALIYTLLAAGCQLHWGQGPQCDIGKGRSGAVALFSQALECSEAVCEAASTAAFQARFHLKVSVKLLIFVFQALLSMVKSILLSQIASQL